MDTNTSATTVQVVAMPDKLHKTADCPKCGAPIYVDAALVAADGSLTGLPMPFFTCMCRFNFNTNPLAINPAPPVTPWPIYPLPQPTWITVSPNGWEPGNLDKIFCGSGGVSQPTNTKYRLYH